MPQHHPRSPYAQRPPDFAALAASNVRFAAHFTASAPFAFSCPAALAALTGALLASDFGVHDWCTPADRLVPTVPSRVNYVLTAQDALARVVGSCFLDARAAAAAALACCTGCSTAAPQCLDVGTGASAILPLLGVAACGFRFVATEVDAESANAARANVAAAGGAFAAAIDVLDVRAEDRLLGPLSAPLPPHALPPIAADSSAALPHGIISSSGDANAARIAALWSTAVDAFAVPRAGPFSLTLCNPPFFKSLEEARESMEGRAASARTGAPSELACEGGEVGFVSRLIAESAVCSAVTSTIFSAWLGLASSVTPLVDAARAAGARHTAVESLSQGKTLRFVFFWSFSSPLAIAAKGWRVVTAGAANTAPLPSEVCVDFGSAMGAREDARGTGPAIAGSKRSLPDGAAEADSRENIRAFSICMGGGGSTSPLLRSVHATRVGSGVFSLRASAVDEAHLLRVAQNGADAKGAPLSIPDIESRIDEALRAMGGGAGAGTGAGVLEVLFWKPSGSSFVDVASAFRALGGVSESGVVVGTALLYRGILFEGGAARAACEVHVFVARERAGSATAGGGGAAVDGEGQLSAVIATCLVSVDAGARPLFDRFSSVLERDVLRLGRAWRRRAAAESAGRGAHGTGGAV